METRSNEITPYPQPSVVLGLMVVPPSCTVEQTLSCNVERCFYVQSCMMVKKDIEIQPPMPELQ